MAQEEAKSPAGKALNFADASRFSTRDEDEAAARGADIPVRIATAQRAGRVMLSCLARAGRVPSHLLRFLRCVCVNACVVSLCLQSQVVFDLPDGKEEAVVRLVAR